MKDNDIYKDIDKEKFKKIFQMNLSETFLYELNNLKKHLDNNDYFFVGLDIDNLYYDIKREEISLEEKEYIKDFFADLLERGD